MGNSGVGGFVATGEVTTKFLIRPSILSKRRTLALNYRYVFVQSQSSYSDRGGAGREELKSCWKFYTETEVETARKWNLSCTRSSQTDMMGRIMCVKKRLSFSIILYAGSNL